jgi:CRISPR-associated endonuclease/helicase Cas3
MQTLFQQITGMPPRQYQLRLSEHIIAGQNIVLTAPTGAGKTWATLAPFLKARRVGTPFADKVIYVLPLRALASSLYKTVKGQLGKTCKDIEVTIQTGPQPEDPFFRGDIVFTTLDQLLSAYIGLPYGTSRASSNIPPGALIGAYVIIDEFHLLSFREALPTFLDMMQRLRQATQFLIMTATAPISTVSKITAHVKGVTFELTSAELAELPSRRRSVTWREESLTAELIIREKRLRTLVIVNTVRRAQDIYMQLSKRLGSEADIRCLHSRFFQEDRKNAEEWLHDRFKQPLRPVILVSTQVVEAGLDITSDILFTDLCPANALLQRAGRCARFGEVDGEIHVFAAYDPKGNRSYYPYASNNEISDGLHPIMLTELFLKENRHIPVLTSKIEQEIIEQCHVEHDRIALKRVFHLLPRRKMEIETALIDGKGDTASLVRSVNNISVIIWDDPSGLRIDLQPDRLSINRDSLRSFLQKQNLVAGVASVLVPSNDEGIHQEMKWISIKVVEEIYRHTLVCLSPTVVDYRSDVGLLLQIPEQGNSVQSKYQNTTPSEGYRRFSYRRETYIEHVMEVRQKHLQQSFKVEIATQRLAALLEVDKERLHVYSEIACALHDVGKLTKQFQKTMELWQLECKDKPEKELLAHTDFDANNADDVQRGKIFKYSRPPHAVEGSKVAETILEQFIQHIPIDTSFDETFNAMRFAVMRHHNAFAHAYRPYQIVPEAFEAIQKSTTGLLEKIDFSECKVENKGADTCLSDVKERLVEGNTLLYYWYFVRRLRLADQASQAANE